MSPLSVAHATEHEFHPDNFITSFINVWKGVIFAPKEFFQEMPRTEGYASPLIFLVICSAIGGTLGSLMLGSISGIIVGPVGGLIGSFIGGAILHLFAMIFADGAKGGFQSTWRVGAYLSALSVVTWIPFIGGIIGLYGIYIAIVGIEEVHSTTTTKAALTVLVPMIGLFILIAALTLILGLTALQFFGTLGR